MKSGFISLSAIFLLLLGSLDMRAASALPKCDGSPSSAFYSYAKTAKWNACIGDFEWKGFYINGKVMSERYYGVYENGRRHGYGFQTNWNYSLNSGWTAEGFFKNGALTKKVRNHPNKQIDDLAIDVAVFSKIKENRQNLMRSGFIKLSADDRKKIQKKLSDLGFYKSSIDGLFGKRTGSALTEYNIEFLKGVNLKKSENVDKLLKAVIDHKFPSEVVEKLPPKVLVNNPSELEVNPKTQPNIKTTSDPVTVIPAEEGPKRDLKKEFGLSLYGSFLHSEKAPKTLFFFSDIEKNDSFEFRKALRNHNIDLVVLSSPGGLVWEGLSIAGIIHDKKLNTYVPKNSLKGTGNCASACSFMFFAGEEKAVNGMLGVHQFYSGDSSKKAEIGDAQKSAQFTVSEIIGFLNEFGTPPWVYERMFQQSNMYYFKENELLQLETETTELQETKFKDIEDFISDLSGAFGGTGE